MLRGLNFERKEKIFFIAKKFYLRLSRAGDGRLRQRADDGIDAFGRAKCSDGAEAMRSRSDNRRAGGDKVGDKKKRTETMR
jgi:hypothetical protein